MTAQDGTASCDTAARGMLVRVQLRSVLREAVGVLQVQYACTENQASADLRHHHDHDAEAARVIAAVDADARGRSDPDWD
ncbi:hypothetical protein ABZU76_23420 [Amycolatopsis sp. NPDC005232]|uniref:hypothetical protein n=1 Tax=Amycolatopsis sp. NPDC005232 TaxID=3157027 RepID=UPI00339F29FD